MENKKYFFGNEISAEGVKNNRVDYRALAKSFNAVLCNDITKLFYASIDGEYNEPEQVNGFIDNSEEIEELNERLEELEENGSADEIEEIQERIEELEREQDEQPEIFQYYIISSGGAQILEDYTNEIVYYLPAIDVYIWGVTHFGTAWSGVLTDIKINENEG